MKRSIRVSKYVFTIDAISFSQLAHYRHFLFIFFLIALIINVAKTQERQVRCEKVESFNWNYVGAKPTCFMDKTTALDASDFSLSYLMDRPANRLQVEGLRLAFSKKIRFLPINVHQSLTSLMIYDAQSCYISTIIWDNFEKLGVLKVLLLNNNQIEKINSDVFTDLMSLEWLVMRKEILFQVFISLISGI